MKSNPPTCSQEHLKSVLHYDPTTGYFVWISHFQSRYIGTLAGGIDDSGYFRIGLKGRKHRAHRLAWFYTYGIWPDQIDHVNGDRADNRISNLRLATQSQNNANRISRKQRLKGTTLSSKTTWAARIRINGKLYYLGNFSSPELAHIAYADAAYQFFGKFARPK